MAILKVQKGKKIYVYIANTWNKRVVEEALKDIPYSKSFIESTKMTEYIVKRTKRDGTKFVTKLAELLRENELVFGFQPLDETEGNLVLFDEVPTNA